jgi:hypothetical protein
MNRSFITESDLKLLNALNQMFVNHPFRPERRPVPEFFVYFPDGDAPKSAAIKNISSTGVYLLTDERWLPGTHVHLTLQRKGPFEKDARHRVTLKSRVVRWGDDGVGLAFTLPADINFNLWQAVLQYAADQTPAEDILPPFRMAQTLEFLCRICPNDTQEIIHLVRTGLGNIRVVNAVQIALNADAMLASDPNGYRMHANSQMVLRIIADGSWADEDWIQQLWAGLLATSCAFAEKDELDPDLANRFSQLAPIHIRIFKAACIKAEKIDSDDWQVVSKPLTLHVKEIQEISGVQSLAKIERDVFHLADLGLLEESVRSRSLMLPEEINVTPSKLGLRLYALCNGHRGMLQEFYGLNG